MMALFSQSQQNKINKQTKKQKTTTNKQTKKIDVIPLNKINITLDICCEEIQCQSFSVCSHHQERCSVLFSSNVASNCTHQCSLEMAVFTCSSALNKAVDEKKNNRSLVRTNRSHSKRGLSIPYDSFRTNCANNEAEKHKTSHICSLCGAAYEIPQTII